MKKLLALAMALCMMLSLLTVAHAADDPITISILTTRHEEGTNEVTDIWIFKYLEKWLADQGYNVKFELEQTYNAAERTALMLATGDLPDILWNSGLSNSDLVMYGAGEGMLLDWTPYLNEETMPNLMAQLKAQPDALAASICNDGKVYGLPYFTERNYPTSTATFPLNVRMWVNSEWLEQLQLEMPTTIDEFLVMLRAFKNNIKIEGKEVYPLMENGYFLRKSLMAYLGFYGNAAYNGLTPMIRNGKIEVPAYTEQYRAFVEILNTMYAEGLISPDYFTMDTTTAQGYMADGVCGVISDWTLGVVGNDFAKWVHLPPLANDHCEKPAASVGTTYRANRTVVSAETEHPEIIAKMLDYLYSAEGSMYYYFGPMKGTDPLGINEGWFYKEGEQMTTDSLEEGTCQQESITGWAKLYIYPAQYAGYAAHLALPETYKVAGLERNIRNWQVTDSVTGNVFDAPEAIVYTHDDNGGHWRLTLTESWMNNITTISLPAVYLTEDEALTVTDLETVLKKHIESETAKFVVGTRPLAEYDQFVKELEGMGVQEYLDIYTKAYSTYMNSVFGE
ncbi:MAG: extracellular solute-binding protein [Clostridia bacterium]|nr:extracellular solute-binding protein [Clostridia bacterium]